MFINDLREIRRMAKHVLDLTDAAIKRREHATRHGRTGEATASVVEVTQLAHATHELNQRVARHRTF